VNAQVGVDEDELAVVERAADAVAGVGRAQDALERRRLLAGDERHPHPQPDGRRSRLPEAAGDEPVLDRGVEADVDAGREEGDLAAVDRARRRRRVRLARARRQRHLRGPQPPGARAHHRAAAAGGGERRLAELDAAARAGHLGGRGQRRDRDRPEQLERDAPEPLSFAALEPLERAPEQGGRRPAVLCVRVPRAARQLGGAQHLAVGLVEGALHARQPKRRAG
jgi:hypothetical protein